MVVPVSLLNKQQTLKQSSMQTEFHTRPRRGTSSVLLESRWIVSTYMMHMALLPSSAALSPSARCYTLFWQVVLPFHSGGSCVSQGFLMVWWLLLKAVLKKKNLQDPRNGLHMHAPTCHAQIYCRYLSTVPTHPSEEYTKDSYECYHTVFKHHLEWSPILNVAHRTKSNIITQTASRYFANTFYSKQVF